MQALLQARNESNAAQADSARTVAQKQVLADNRPEALAQCKLTEMINSSSGVLQQWSLSNAIHNSPRMFMQRHKISAYFGGAMKSKINRSMKNEAWSAQGEEKINHTGLPNYLKSGIESLSGMSMDHVKVHYNSDKPTQLQAHAYAQGSDIYLGAGQERHLPHEAWHIVQQAQGRVRPTLQMKAGRVNDDPSLEKEADMMGEKAVQFDSGYDSRNLVAEDCVGYAVTQHVPSNLSVDPLAVSDTLPTHASVEGNAIHFAAGQERQLTQEARNLVQQSQERVQPTLQMKAHVADVSDQFGVIQRTIGNYGRKVLGYKVHRLGKKKDIYNICHVVENVKGQFIYGVENSKIGYRVEAGDFDWELEEGQNDPGQIIDEDADAEQTKREAAVFSAASGLGPDELQQVSESAVAQLIINRYLEKIGVNKRFHIEDSEIVFFTGAQWVQKVRESRTKGEPEDIEAFELNKKIYINGANHTIGTIVHELFHHVSNNAFGDEDWDEAMTEYFTQHALAVDARFSLNRKSAIYMSNVRMLTSAMTTLNMEQKDIVALYFSSDKAQAQKIRKHLHSLNSADDSSSFPAFVVASIEK
jgi:hypothetical protein